MDCYVFMIPAIVILFAAARRECKSIYGVRG